MMGWKVPTYVVEPEESYVLYNFISFPTPEFKSLKLMVSHIKLKKYRFPGQYEDASEIGSNHITLRPSGILLFRRLQIMI